ncbi:hypothetical protein BVX99_02655 [bacterium F16]|nr:hypothetical protein BVX99_02655 [bacterium F16]
MMNTTNDTTTREGGLAEKMQGLITVLTDSALQMRDAIIHRRCEDIWQIMSEKQQQVAELEQYLVLWRDLYGGVEIPTDTQLGKDRLHIKTGLVELKRVENSNASLSQTYLGAIRKALGRAGEGIATQKKVYTKRGMYGKNTKSLLINQFG